jgi:uncharacterized small protein (DUF1192 family)
VKQAPFGTVPAMWRRRRTAVADRPTESMASLRTEIARLTTANRARREPAVERQLLQLRHRVGIGVLDASPGAPEHPFPDRARLPSAATLPDIAPAAVTPELMRAGILRDGCLLVRGLVDRGAALDLAGEIDRAFAERDRHDAGGSAADGYYDEFEPDARFGEIDARPWIKEGGGLLAVDSPRLAFTMLELFEAAGVPALVEGYLGEPSLLSAHKTTLRKAEPSVPGAWHQDGKFMGEVRALNLWLALSRCGDEAPGLDIVPRRLDGTVTTQTDEAVLSYQVSHEQVVHAAGAKGIVRPIFEPGDALFFDELFLHQTGSDPSMPNPRFAIESWFFGGSGFPGDYAPITV